MNSALWMWFAPCFRLAHDVRVIQSRNDIWGFHQSKSTYVHIVDRQGNGSRFRMHSRYWIQLFKTENPLEKTDLISFNFAFVTGRGHKVVNAISSIYSCTCNRLIWTYWLLRIKSNWSVICLGVGVSIDSDNWHFVWSLIVVSDLLNIGRCWLRNTF